MSPTRPGSQTRPVGVGARVEVWSVLLALCDGLRLTEGDRDGDGDGDGVVGVGDGGDDDGLGDGLGAT